MPAKSTVKKSTKKTTATIPMLASSLTKSTDIPDILSNKAEDNHITVKIFKVLLWVTAALIAVLAIYFNFFSNKAIPSIIVVLFGLAWLSLPVIAILIIVNKFRDAKSVSNQMYVIAWITLATIPIDFFVISLINSTKSI